MSYGLLGISYMFYMGYGFIKQKATHIRVYVQSTNIIDYEAMCHR